LDGLAGSGSASIIIEDSSFEAARVRACLHFHRFESLTGGKGNLSFVLARRPHSLFCCSRSRGTVSHLPLFYILLYTPSYYEVLVVRDVTFACTAVFSGTENGEKYIVAHFNFIWQIVFNR
jgi:hypothetical protein